MRKVLLLLLLLLVACIKVDPSAEIPNEGMNRITGTAGVIPTAVLEDVEEAKEVEEMKTEEPAEVVDIPIKRVKVGELVHFPNLQAIDEDGDKLNYKFEAPLNNKGTWQTGPGDEGTYEVDIQVSDGDQTTVQTVRIIVESLNAPPELQGVEDITVREGETIRFNVKAIDPEGDKVRVSFDGWRNSFPYQTTFKDAGVHTVKVIAKDGTHTIERVVTITVTDVNRPPVIHEFEDVLVMEGDEIIVRADADDPDGDQIEFKYSSPLDNKGRWQTKKEDEGIYRVNVSAFDGKVRDSSSFRIVVEGLNRRPVVKSIPDVTVKEGETVTIELDAQDPEQEKLEITWHGFMMSEEKVTTFDDAGEHLVTITVSDGYHEVNESFLVTVENVNRAPVFVANAFE